MASGPSRGPAGQLELLRREYESSLSWRLTRPLRALGRLARGSRAETAEKPVSSRYDSWLEAFPGERLERLDAACAAGGADKLALFRELDDDLWALLLTQEYELYPNIRALLPDVPEASFQELWNGASGVALAAQSKAFYAKLKGRFREHSSVPLEAARVLDFGCGWGRLTRFLTRDVEPGDLYGCDPVEGILDVCRRNGVPATLARSEFLPERVPFDVEFDLAFSFSVFTHLSERSHEACLRALHGSLKPGAILVVTVRPPAYLAHSEMMRPPLDSPRTETGFVFAPHPVDPGHPQYVGGQMDYGEAVITLPYIREHWASMFELLHVDLLIGDLHQVMLTLRRKQPGAADAIK
jgi:SAM-dependent methyltransferase